MFGHDWEPAQATVIAVKQLSNWTGDPNSAWTQSVPHEYVVDVRPPGQPPFRATFRDPYIRGYMDHPTEGQVINVLYQPKSHKGKLIEEEWKCHLGPRETAKKAENERFNAAAHDTPAPEGTPPSPASTRVIRPGEASRIENPAPPATPAD